MIVPYLKGGLGNQMFQIAAAFAHAKRLNTDYAINLHIPHNCIQGKHPSKYAEFYQKIPQTDRIPAERYNEPHFHYKQIESSSDCLIDGYFQSAKYFESFALGVANLFTFPQQVVDKVQTALEKVRKRSGFDKLTAVHIRRGDYKIYHTTHPCYGADYYYAALEKLPLCKNLIVCSDDWDSVFAEKIFDFTDKGPDSTTAAINSTELEDLYLISQCDNVIMSNSSFAWWGQFLGKPKEVVVAPSQWFGPDGPQDYQDIFQPHFICC